MLLLLMRLAIWFREELEAAYDEAQDRRKLRLIERAKKLELCR